MFREKKSGDEEERTVLFVQSTKIEHKPKKICCLLEQKVEWCFCVKLKSSMYLKDNIAVTESLQIAVVTRATATAKWNLLDESEH